MGHALIAKASLISDSACHLHSREDCLVGAASLTKSNVVHLNDLCFVIVLLCAQSVVLQGSPYSTLNSYTPGSYLRNFVCKADIRFSFGTTRIYILHGKYDSNNPNV